MNELDNIEFIVGKLAKWVGIDIVELDDEYGYSESIEVIRDKLKEDE